MVGVSAPYVAGFLAFREAPFLVEAVQRLEERAPGLVPQVLFVDGNGILHHRGKILDNHYLARIGFSSPFLIGGLSYLEALEKPDQEATFLSRVTSVWRNSGLEDSHLVLTFAISS
uniref:Endonuclease V n=1 Tax=Anolis carolinensis TaxID=28377 RepID=A0A803TFJ9_ANOCA